MRSPWVEQGRDIALSAAALARLADTLQLSAAERAYLFELARRRDPARRCCMDDLEFYQRCKLRQKHVLGPKWHGSFRIRRFFRVVASSYHPRLAYAEGILLKSLNSLSGLNC